MDLSGLKLIRSSAFQTIKSFDCGDHDLNEFLLSDSGNYSTQLLAVTYLIESDTETAAFFSLLNDKISIVDVDSKNKWRKFFRDVMPAGKRFRSYPAVKIGRLGVCNNFQRKGLGTVILDYLKELFVTNNRTGCKYLTVDAYKRSLKYYEKNGFKYLTQKDKNADTRLMYFDLMQVS